MDIAVVGSRRALRRVLRSSLTSGRSLKRKENWRKLLLLGIQTGDKLAKPTFFVAYSRLCRHCGSLAKRSCLSVLSRMSLLFGSCRLSEFTLVGSLNWSGKVDQKNDKRCYFYLFIHLLSIFYLPLCNPPGAKVQNIDAQHWKNIDYAIIPTKYRLVQFRPSRTTFTSMAEMASENAPLLEG